MENIVETKEYSFSYSKFEYLYNIFDGLSFSIFLSPLVIDDHFLDSTLLDNACDIIRTIDFSCKRGYYSVGYVLSRELCESVLQYLYFFQLGENFKNGISIGEVEKDILNAWFENTVNKTKRKIRQQILSCNNYINFLRGNDSNVLKMTELFNDKWELINSLNDYVHINGEHYLKHRTLFHDFDPVKEENNLIDEVLTIGVMLVCLIAIVNPIAFRSDDYVDALEAGIKPEDNSEYWVKPFFSEFIQRESNKINPALYPFIQSNNKYGMKF